MSHTANTKSASPEVICLGEALIDFIALEAGISLIEVSGFKKAPGGATANVAGGLAKLGNASAFIGKVGDDPFGRFLEKTFSDSGVDTSRMVFDPTVKTTLAFVALTAAGVPDFMFYRDPGADMLLKASELDAEFIRSARIFHYGSISLISEPSRSATEVAIDYAKDSGHLISYDPNYRPPLWPGETEAGERMLAAMAHPHVVKISEVELAFLTGTADLDKGSAQLMSAYPNIKLLAVTLGPEGCYYRTGKVVGAMPALKVDVVDTTGAGDGFVAGLLSCLLTKVSIPAQIDDLSSEDLNGMFHFATTVAGLTTTKLGAISAVPTRAEVERLIQTGV
jgi:fructokinase